jgi:hypothetical protein
MVIPFRTVIWHLKLNYAETEYSSTDFEKETAPGWLANRIFILPGIAEIIHN